MSTKNPTHKIKLFLENFPPSKKNKKFKRTVLTRTDSALNVNHFGQSVCGLQTTHLRTNNMTPGYIKLKYILKRRTSFVNQTIMLLTGSGALTNSSAYNPFFVWGTALAASELTTYCKKRKDKSAICK